MQKVLEQYAKRIAKILQRASLRKPPVLTPKEHKAVAWYRTAAERVKALMDQPKPAWVDAVFIKKLGR